MNIKAIFSIVLLLDCGMVFAQQYDALDQVRSDWRKAAAMEGPHRFEDKAPLTKAPKGYKPFYIDHYGRHGSRYSYTDETYKVIQSVIVKAHEEGVLTQLGEEFYRKYEDFYFIPLLNTGYLTDLGFEQHKRIGQFVYDNFSEVFKGKKSVEALSSVAPRCIVSMSSFCLSLKGGNPGLEIHQTSNTSGMDIITPPDGPSRKRKYALVAADSINHLMGEDEFYKSIIDGNAVYSRFFTDTTFISRQKEKDEFLFYLVQFLNGYRNYSKEAIFDGMLTNEQMTMAWEASNYGSFYYDTRARYRMIPLLEDFILKAEDAFKDPSKAANLRFGHDYILEAFTCLLNLNGCGTIPEKESEVKYWFQSYNIPMAATVFFVFYRNKAKDDILFKVIWNEEEARLPQLAPVEGCYYRWADFTAWASGIIQSHPLL